MFMFSHFYLKKIKYCERYRMICGFAGSYVGSGEYIDERKGVGRERGPSKAGDRQELMSVTGGPGHFPSHLEPFLWPCTALPVCPLGSVIMLSQLRWLFLWTSQPKLLVIWWLVCFPPHLPKVRLFGAGDISVSSVPISPVPAQRSLNEHLLEKWVWPSYPCMGLGAIPIWQVNHEGSDLGDLTKS